ncbi:MAG: hypothetical protein KUG56_08625 [Kordiimonadaceae bacterium]|nr:hypothetical protein [Kordiimonadaceae bacterium]
MAHNTKINIQALQAKALVSSLFVAHAEAHGEPIGTAFLSRQQGYVSEGGTLQVAARAEKMVRQQMDKTSWRCAAAL